MNPTQDTLDLFNGQYYNENSASQKAIAANLIRHIPIKNNSSILDIGCGDGKIPAKLATLTKGRVLGVDPSESQITFAKKTYCAQAPNLSFMIKGASDLDFSNEFDFAVTMNAALWFPDHDVFLDGVERSLKEGGTFGMVCYLHLNDNFQKVLDEQMAKQEWNSYFKGFSDGWNFPKQRSFEQKLKERGFKIIRSEVFVHKDVLPKDQFYGFMDSFLPHVHPIPSELRKKFMTEAVERYFELEPIDFDGNVHYWERHLQIIAKKEK